MKTGLRQIEIWHLIVSGDPSVDLEVNSFGWEQSVRLVLSPLRVTRRCFQMAICPSSSVPRENMVTYFTQTTFQTIPVLRGVSNIIPTTIYLYQA